MRAVVGVVLIVSSGCLIEVDYGSTRFLCTGATECPTGYECLREGCVPELTGELLVHWSFDNVGTTAADSSGNGRVGQVVGASSELGRFGDALRFDGLGGSVSDPAADYLNGLTAITVTAWVRSDVIDSDLGILTGRFPSDGDTGDGAGLSLRYDALGGSGGGVSLLKVGVSTAIDEQQMESASNTQTTEWQFLAFTWAAGTDLEVYIDGAKTIPTDLEPAVSGGLSGVEDLVVGKGAKDISTSWSGLIDDLRIYAGVLTDQEIRIVGGL